MGAGADALCGAPYGQVSEDRVNYRSGYRQRRGGTWAGTIGLAIPRLRPGNYFPEWLLERRRRAEQALISVVATSYLLGVSTRRVEKLAETPGSPACRSRRCPSWPRAWTRRRRSSGPGR